MVEIDNEQLDDYGLTTQEISDFESMQGMEGEYSKKSDFSKALLGFNCTQAVFNARAKEMKKGYYNYKYLPDGNELKFWVADSRREYVSAVKALNIIVAPELTNYKEIAKKIAELKKKEKAIWDMFAYTEIYLDENQQVKETGVVFMPEQDTELLIKFSDDSCSKISGAWDLKLEHYWNAMVDIYDEIFEQISLLMHECNYFKGKIRIG